MLNMSAAAVIVCAVTVLALAATSHAQDDWVQPDFCINECPQFETESEGEDYDVREYEDMKVVTTEFSANSVNYDNRSKEAYYRLRDYAQGLNSAGAEIPETTPMMSKVYPCNTEGCEANYVKSMYVDPAFHENTPTPTDASVYLEEIESMTVFVRSFTGWSNYKSADAHAENVAALKEDVNDPTAYVSDYYIIGGYGPKFTVAAYSEAWLVAV